LRSTKELKLEYRDAQLRAQTANREAEEARVNYESRLMEEHRRAVSREVEQGEPPQGTHITDDEPGPF
jgi:hypothetical protein